MAAIGVRENYLRAIRREGAGWVPFALGFAPAALEKFQQATGRTDYADFFRFPTVWYSPPAGPAAPERRAEAFERYYVGIERPPGSRLDENGVLHLPGSLYHFTRMVHPLRDATSAADVEGYPFPPLPPAAFTEADLAAMRRQVEDMKRRDRAVLGGAGAIFEAAWSLRGLAAMLADFATGHEVSLALLDHFGERAFRKARASALAGCDVIDAGDDVGMEDRMMMSPDLWRRVIKPRAARVFAEARRIKPDIHITYHSDGYIEPIIPDLIEIGVDILNPVQPECMDQAKLKRLYGGRLCFERCIGTQTVLPFWTPEAIERQVKWTIDVVGRGGGLLLGPTHTIEPDVPWENVVAFYEAVLRHGGYENYPGEMPPLGRG